MQAELPNESKTIETKDGYSTAQIPSLVWTVSDLNEQVRQTLESRIGQVWVRGEISGFVVATSGHWYFQLKDAQAQVKVAMFRMRASQVLIKPKNGDEVEICAEVGLYVPRGEYQLVALSMRAVGAGQLYEMFLKYKALLSNEGLFDAQRKKRLPFFVRRVAVITSSNAAALHDVAAAMARRAPYIELCLFPTSVQGAGSAQGVVNALAVVNELSVTNCHFDVILLVRGGGSIEDLWTFNEVAVVRAVSMSLVPVVSGVGHESDVTLTDLVADVRAATPTAAAELVAKPRLDWFTQLDYNEQRLLRSTERTLERLFQYLDHLNMRLPSPRARLVLWQLQLQQLTHRLSQRLRNVYYEYRARLQRADDRLMRALTNQAGVKFYASQLLVYQKALRMAVDVRFQADQQRLKQLELRLEKYNPKAPLERGYALVFKNKQLISGVGQACVGDQLYVQLIDGVLPVLVQSNDDK